VTARRPRGGSRPRIGTVAATARVEIVLPPDVKARWQAAADELRQDVSTMIRTAVEAHLARRVISKEQAE